MSENFAQMLEESLKKLDIVAGNTVQATVLEITSDYVTVTAGLKSESLIPVAEFYDKDGELEIKEGDQVEVILAEGADSDGFGTTLLSREKAKRAEQWKSLQAAYQAKETIEGLVVEKVKGGFIVELGALQAFLPGSLIDVRGAARETEPLENKTMMFKVVKMDEKRNNIVVSRRAVVQEVSQADIAQLMDSLTEGQEIKGMVKNLTDYGAFVDLGGIDGLLHITDISWKRVRHPRDVLQVGQEIIVKVLSFDKENSRVSLSLKDMGEDPWSTVSRTYPVGSRLLGKVTNITDYGCFVEIADAVEGLVHMSEMDWTNKNIHPAKIVQVGSEVEVLILEVNTERRRISLGIKQCLPNPWDTFAAMHAINDKVTGQVKSITDFGIFIGLPGNIDGLVHSSDISWSESGEKAVRKYQKGDEVEAVILGIDPSRERISLSIKQLETEGVSLDKRYSKGTKVTGQVTGVEGDIVKLAITDAISAEINLAEIEGEIAEGDQIEAKVSQVDEDASHLKLTKKQIAAPKASKRTMTSKAPTNMTLGDLIKEKMQAQEEASDEEDTSQEIDQSEE